MIMRIICAMKYTWDESKRQSNLNQHGLDFSDAEKLFSGPVVLFENTQNGYSEQKMIAAGLLDFSTVLVVYVKSGDETKIISMRKADSDETDLYYKNAGYF